MQGGNGANKLIVTIVKKGMGSKVISASKTGGVGGGTIVLGKGTAKRLMPGLLETAGESDKEVVFTMAGERLADRVLCNICEATSLDKPGEGIAFVLGLKSVAGMSHPGAENAVEAADAEEVKRMEKPIEFELIIAIMKYGLSDDAIIAARKVGAGGATILNSRGAGIHESAKLFNIPIEPERETLLVLTQKDITEKVLRAITEAAKLDQPGQGIAFILAVEKAVGITHLQDKQPS